jgi:hypothetical protein
MQRQKRHLIDPLHNERPMRLKNGPAPPSYLTGATEPVVRRRCDHFAPNENATSNWATTVRQISPPKVAVYNRLTKSLERGGSKIL